MKRNSVYRLVAPTGVRTARSLAYVQPAHPAAVVVRPALVDQRVPVLNSGAAQQNVRLSPPPPLGVDAADGSEDEEDVEEDEDDAAGGHLGEGDAHGEGSEHPEAKGDSVRDGGQEDGGTRDGQAVPGDLVVVLDGLVESVEAPGDDEHVIDTKSEEEEGQDLDTRGVELDAEDGGDSEATPVVDEES